jgi:DNA repair exonuclease SbcCD nuclease subunit
MAARTRSATFLHCADLHLDSPMRGLARYDGAPLEALRGATRQALEKLVDLAVDEQVRAVVVAGDLYDGNRDDYQTAVFLQRQLHRLREADVPVVLAYGNHDAESEITRRLVVPGNTTVLPASDPRSVVLADVGLAFHGQSYSSRVVDDDISAGYPAPVPGFLNVGVLHTSLDGRPGHARYAPCTLDGLARRGYQYWALGHVHRREEHLRDGTTVVFPGNICGRDVQETGAKGATLVEYDGDVVTGVAHRELAPVRWHRLEVDARGVTSVAGLTEAMLDHVARARRAAPDVLHAVRLDVVADPRARGAWLHDAESAEAQLRADAAGADGSVWLERIEVRSVAERDRPGAPGEAVAAITATLRDLRDGEDGRRVVATLLAGIRARFGAERDAAIRLGAIGLDDVSLDALIDETGALLAAELEGEA